MSPREIADRTPVSLRLTLGLAALAFAAGTGYALGQARAQALEQRVGTVEIATAKSVDALAAQNVRLSLVERAVVSLERMAAETRR